MSESLKLTELSCTIFLFISFLITETPSQADMFILTNELNSFRKANWINVQLIEYNYETKNLKLIENSNGDVLILEHSYDDENGNQVYVLNEDIQITVAFLEEEYLQVLWSSGTDIFFYKKLLKIKGEKLQIRPFQKMIEMGEIKEINGHYFFYEKLNNSHTKILLPIIGINTDKFTYDSMKKDGNMGTKKEEYYFQ
jgi:hypothetical protein